MEDLTYAGFKQILLDWTATIAKASIDGTRSDKDAEGLRFDLLNFIQALSSSDLKTSKVQDVARQFRQLANKVSGSDDYLNPKDIGKALSSISGASMKEFNEWQSGGLGKAVEKKLMSILEKDRKNSEKDRKNSEEDWLHS